MTLFFFPCSFQVPEEQVVGTAYGGDAVDEAAARSEKKQRKKERRAERARLEATQGLAVVAPVVVEEDAGGNDDDEVAVSARQCL